MTSEQAFSIANLIAMAGWLILLVFGRSRWAASLVTGAILPQRLPDGSDATRTKRPRDALHELLIGRVIEVVHHRRHQHQVVLVSELVGPCCRIGTVDEVRLGREAQLLPL